MRSLFQGEGRLQKCKPLWAFQAAFPDDAACHSLCTEPATVAEQDTWVSVFGFCLKGRVGKGSVG